MWVRGTKRERKGLRFTERKCDCIPESLDVKINSYDTKIDIVNVCLKVQFCLHFIHLGHDPRRVMTRTLRKLRDVLCLLR